MHHVVARKSITANYTLTPDDKIISVSTASGDVRIQLPAISEIGSVYNATVIHATATNQLYIDASTGNTINNGLTTFSSRNAGDVIKLESISSTLWNITTNSNENKFRDRIAFNSNLDTVSPPILMRGGVNVMNMYPESKINDNLTAFQTRLDSTDTWTDVSVGVNLATTINYLLEWVDTNVGNTTQWEYRAIITYDSGQDGETSILVDYVI